MGVRRIGVVANKLWDGSDEAFIRSKIPEEELLGLIHYHEGVMIADRNGAAPFDNDPRLIDELLAVKRKLDLPGEEP